MFFKSDDSRLFYLIKHDIFHIAAFILKIQVDDIFTKILYVFS